jgi:hypothetical protein
MSKIHVHLGDFSLKLCNFTLLNGTYLAPRHIKLWRLDQSKVTTKQDEKANKDINANEGPDA